MNNKNSGLILSCIFGGIGLLALIMTMLGLGPEHHDYKYGDLVHYDHPFYGKGMGKVLDRKYVDRLKMYLVKKEDNVESWMESRYLKS